MNDPLEILREDTFTNEETNEMVGTMIRKQSVQRESNWTVQHNADNTSTYDFGNGNAVVVSNKTKKAYKMRNGEPLDNESFSIDGLSVDDWHNTLHGIQSSFNGM